MNYQSKSEADASFDERFLNPDIFSNKGILNPKYENGRLGYAIEDIKSHISSLRTADLDALIEHCEDVKVKEHEIDLSRADDPSFVEGKEKNETLSDIISHLRELKETNK